MWKHASSFLFGEFTLHSVFKEPGNHRRALRFPAASTRTNQPVWVGEEGQSDRREVDYGVRGNENRLSQAERAGLGFRLMSTSPR